VNGSKVCLKRNLDALLLAGMIVAVDRVLAVLA
jgi:hypothetical protein